MGERIYFSDTNYIIPCILISILCWLLFLWKEGFLIKKTSFWVNAIVALLAILALLFLYTKPYYLGSSIGKRNLLLTENSQQSKYRDSLLQLYPGIEEIFYQPNQPIFKEDKLPKELFILGDGVKTYDFWQLESIPTIHYLFSDSLQGISQVTYNDNLVEGNKLKVSGVYQNSIVSNSLFLESEGGFALDSVLLRGHQLDTFSLSSTIKVSGSYVYQLVEKDSLQQILRTEPLPVQVKTAQALNIVLLNTFPNFESKYLKNFLSDQGHRLVVRNQISKGKFKYEYINDPDFQFLGFKKESLTSPDLIIMSSSVLNVMSQSEKNALHNSVKKEGIGVLILPSFKVSLKSIQEFTGFTLRRNQKETANLSEEINIELETYPFEIKRSLPTLPIWKSSDERVVAAYQQLKNGRIGISLIKNTYPLLLKGNEKAYQAYWVKLINAIIKLPNSKVQWEDKPNFIFKDKPYTFHFRSNLALPEVYLNNSHQIPLLQDPELSYLWNGTTYPKEIGWNTLQMVQDTLHTQQFYVLDSSRWKTWQKFHQRKQNKNLERSLNTTHTNFEQQRPVPLWYFYLLFLISMGWLWFDGKRRSL
ncbi:hypothetical protein NBT05_17485 [Aquimarina sp. ERC-38]|uniref:hypothetical protein n=1 Tax=Aquimarina sp. ERC-38 TaxID=2949996 RepID=UPI0022467816|nr:hypothetical protein [Aquimarina sp. ERC-38]UZO80722.1 hypothetical protein NBT05_17485 [Aquimarina sp. ERC-38]